MAQAARAIDANIFSPCGTCFIPSFVTFEDDPTFTTQAMIREAHTLGLIVKPWTVSFQTSNLHFRVALTWCSRQMNGLDRIDELHRFGVDGIITDCTSCCARCRPPSQHTTDPSIVRRWAKQQGLAVAPKYPKQRVFSCLEKHLHHG